MSFHLDTNAVIAVLSDNPPAVRRRLRDEQRKGSTFSVSSIVLFELWFGAAKSGHWQENANRIRDFLKGNVGVAAFDADSSQVAGELRATLQAAGTPIGSYDLLIAAQAIRHGVTLVTANIREFARVPGLRCEDWST